MQVESQLIEEILARYNKEAHFLAELDFHFPNATATFEINEKPLYYNEALDHLSVVEVEVCLNQMASVFFAKAAEQGMLPNLSLENFLNKREDCYLRELTFEFSKKIRPAERFTARFTLEKWRNLTPATVSKVSFDFENRSIIGTAKFALIK